MMKLWNTIANHYGVLSARRARDAYGEARAYGYLTHFDDSLEDSFNGEERALEPRALAWWTDETSGCPSSLWETVMALIAAGFTPDKCWILGDKLKKLVGTKLKQIGDDYHYPVPMSCSGIIVPGEKGFMLSLSCLIIAMADPYGVLQPDEIQLRSSQNDLLMPDGLQSNMILGDVLVGVFLL
jgi:RNA-dependent RNA polymerase